MHMSGENQKLKLLYLIKIFEEETDDTHGLTTPQLIERLADYGVEIERKTLYRDIAALQEYGYDIQKYYRSPIEYGLASRTFQEGELMLMADAVQSSKFLTQKKANSLVNQIAKMGGNRLANSLKRNMHVEGRIKAQNESVYYNVDAIQRAMAAKRKINFRYFRYDENKKRVMQRNGNLYTETPVQLIYMNDCYYLVVWNDKYQNFTNYRVDRMLEIEVSEEPATRNEQIASFDVAKYQERSFDMFNGQPVSVVLRVQESAMNAVIDRFGKDVRSVNNGDGSAQVHVSVMESPTFYGWLATFGDQMTIESPDRTRQAFLEYLENILRVYSM